MADLKQIIKEPETLYTEYFQQVFIFEDYVKLKSANMDMDSVDFCQDGSDDFMHLF